MKRALGIAAGLGVLAVSTPSAAASPSQSEIGESMRSYYGGERASAYIVTGLGAASIGAGAYLVTRDSDFARGMGWPLLGLGVLEGIGGLFYAFQVNAEIDHYEAALARDPATFRDEELAHLAGTRSRFIYYRLTELALTLAGAGIATYGFAANRDVYKGVGLGLASVGIPFLIIDTINDARLDRYIDDVRTFQPVVVPAPAAAVAATRSSAFGFSISGTF